MANIIYASTPIQEVDRLAREAGALFVGATSMNGIFQVKEDHPGDSALWCSRENNGNLDRQGVIDYDVARHWPHP